MAIGDPGTGRTQHGSARTGLSQHGARDKRWMGRSLLWSLVTALTPSLWAMALPLRVVARSAPPSSSLAQPLSIASTPVAPPSISPASVTPPLATPAPELALTFISQRLPELAVRPGEPGAALGDRPSSRALYEAGHYRQALEQLQGQATAAQGSPGEQAAILGNLALVYQALGEPQQALVPLQQALGLAAASEDGGAAVTAQLLSLRGQIELSLGQAERALASWEQAEANYRLVDQELGQTRSLIYQAQALQQLGFYRRALTRLTALAPQLQAQANGPEKVLQLRVLGDSLQLVGDAQEAEVLLNQALALAQGLGLEAEISAIALSLGNGAAARGDRTQAIAHYSQAIAQAPTALLKLQAQVNRFSLEAESSDPAAARLLIPEIQQQLSQVPPQLDALYAQLRFGQVLTKAQLGEQALALQILEQAQRQAQTIDDLRSQSYAAGYLAALHQQQGQGDRALDLTRQALVLAQRVNAPEVAYRWSHQLGQLLQQKGDLLEAIAAYDAAIADLARLRSDLTTVNRDVQFSFRESIEPIYRESVALLLAADPDSQTNLDKARQRIESLQLAELDNFFREACIDAQTVAIDQIVDQDNPTAAVIYPIVLDDRLEVIVKIPQQPLERYSIDQSAMAIAEVAQQLQASLKEPDQMLKVQQQGQKLHQWLIAPLEQRLQTSSAPVDTLVFVLDGPLRSVPMAVLYDGEQYLIEKYAIALSLGLQLLDPRPLAPQQLDVLAAGLAEVPLEYQQFPSLPGVPIELAQIDATLEQTQLLLDQDFTLAQLTSSVQNNPFNVLHLATHGQFSSTAENTFVLAADGPINVNQFDDLLRQRETNQSPPIELLVLSACQTAVGDDRATLGLAGVAVRAGARSTLASLWNIGDDSTAELIGEFYRQLASGNLTKAEALRRAQLNLLDNPNYSRPAQWAPYVLVGNWL